jgi:hypothetical protein
MAKEKIEWHSEKRKLSELIPSEYNPRKATEKQAKDLARSLDKFSLADPIIINTDNRIVGGHFRYNVLKGKGSEIEVDVRVPNRMLTDEEERELNVRLNKNTGDFDYSLLANFDEVMLQDIGFSSKELDIVFQLNEQTDNSDLLSSKTENLKTNESRGMSYELKEDVKFDGAGDFDIPVIRSDMILEIG